MLQAINQPHILFTLLKTFDMDLKKIDEFHFDKLKPFYYTPQPEIITPPPILIVPNTLPQPLKVKEFQGTLFQCILHSIQGISGRNYSENSSIRDELNEKQKIVEALSTGKLDKKSLKMPEYRTTKAEIEEVISDLITLSTRKHEYLSCFGFINLNLLQTILYSRYYKKNIVIFCPLRKIYVAFSKGEEADSKAEAEDDTIYLRILSGTQFETVSGKPAEWSLYYKAENWLNVLKTISHYKIAELKVLYTQLLGSHPPDALKKQELYEAIVTFATKSEGLY